MRRGRELTQVLVQPRRERVPFSVGVGQPLDAERVGPAELQVRQVQHD